MSDNATLRARLAEYMRKVPAGVNNGSYQTAIKFKEFAGEVRKALNNHRTTDSTLMSLISRYEGFK